MNLLLILLIFAFCALAQGIRLPDINYIINDVQLATANLGNLKSYIADKISHAPDVKPAVEKIAAVSQSAQATLKPIWHSYPDIKDESN